MISGNAGSSIHINEIQFLPHEFLEFSTLRVNEVNVFIDIVIFLSGNDTGKLSKGNKRSL
jgi:hypothetical protein